MKNCALVSVIIPVYKVEKYLDECIHSVVNQTYDNLEIILVDDGSPDNCPNMCDAWSTRDSRIKVIHKKNGGLSDARNTGIRNASGEWLLFIDSDDAIPVRFISELVSASSDSNCLAVSGTARFVDQIPAEDASEIVPVKCSKDIASVRGGMYSCGVLYSRDLLSSIDLWFDTALRNLEDVVWNGIYLRYVAEVVFVNVTYYYRMNPTSITSKCADIKWQISSWIAARKSIMEWFEHKQITDAQKKEVSKMFRHCQNNIYAECVAGNVSFLELQELEKDNSLQFCEDMLPTLERFVRKNLPRVYYGVYVFLIKSKNALRKLK